MGSAEYLGHLLQLELLWSLDWSRVGLFFFWSLARGPGRAGWSQQGACPLGCSFLGALFLVSEVLEECMDIIFPRACILEIFSFESIPWEFSSEVSWVLGV